MNKEFLNVLGFIFVGTIGALVRLIVVYRGKIIFPHFILNEKKRISGVDLGFIGSLVVGAAIAAIVDQSPWTALWASIAAPQLIEEVAKRKGGGINDIK